MFNKRQKTRGVNRQGGAGIAMNDDAWLANGGLKDEFLKEPAVLTAVKLIVSEIGSISLKAVDNSLDKEITASNNLDAYKVLYRKANGWQTTSDFIRGVVLSMLSNKDTFIKIDKRGTSKPVVDAMRLLDDGTVSVQRNTNGSFTLSGNYSDGKKINPNEILWIKSPLVVNGMSIEWIDYIKTLVDLSKSTLTNANQLARRGPLAGGVVETPEDMTDDQWNEFSEGISNSIKKSEVLILDQGSKWVQTNNLMKELEFDKNRLAQIKEIATVFGIPLPLLGIPDSSYKSYEEVRQAFHASCLYPIMKQITDALEEAWNYQLTIRFDSDELAGVPISTRVDVADKMVKLGSFPLNEARIAIGRPPLKELEGIYAVETNNLTLEERDSIQEKRLKEWQQKQRR